MTYIPEGVEGLVIGGDFFEQDVLVDKNIAEKWLAGMGRQRPKKTRKEEEFAYMMASGKWQKELWDPIRFDKQGNFRDGNHRMLSLVMAAEAVPDIKIWFRVQWNVSEAALLQCDTGTSRTLGDLLGIEGYTNGKQLSTVVRRCYYWTRKEYMATGGNTVHAPSNTELMEFFRTCEDSLRFSTSRGVDVYKHGGKLIPVSLGGSAHWILTTTVDYELADYFFEKLMTASIGVEGHPVHALRNRLSSNYHSTKKTTTAQVMAHIMLAWNHFVADKPVQLSTILLPRTRLSNTTFPLPRKPSEVAKHHLHAEVLKDKEQIR